MDDVVEGKAFGELLLAGWTGGRMAEGRFREWLRTRGGVSWKAGGRGAVTDCFQTLGEALPPTPLVRGPVRVTEGLDGRAVWWWHVQGCTRCQAVEGGDPSCAGAVVAWMWEHGIPVPLLKVPDPRAGGGDYCKETEGAMIEDLDRLIEAGKVQEHVAPQEDVLYLPRFQVVSESWKQVVLGEEVSEEMRDSASSGGEESEDDEGPGWWEGEGDWEWDTEETGQEREWRKVEKVRPVVDATPVNRCSYLTGLEYPDPFELFPTTFHSGWKSVGIQRGRLEVELGCAMWDAARAWCGENGTAMGDATAEVATSSGTSYALGIPRWRTTGGLRSRIRFALRLQRGSGAAVELVEGKLQESRLERCHSCM